MRACEIDEGDQRTSLSQSPSDCRLLRKRCGRSCRQSYGRRSSCTCCRQSCRQVWRRRINCVPKPWMSLNDYTSRGRGKEKASPHSFATRLSAWVFSKSTQATCKTPRTLVSLDTSHMMMRQPVFKPTFLCGRLQSAQRYKACPAQLRGRRHRLPSNLSFF